MNPTGGAPTFLTTETAMRIAQTGILSRTELQANLEAAAVVAVAGFAVILTAISAYSYIRLRRIRAFYISAAFFVFALKGIWLVIQVLASPGQQDWILPIAVLDLLILLMMFLAVKRSTGAN